MAIATCYLSLDNNYYGQKELQEKLQELEGDFESIQQNVMDILEEKGIGIKKLKRAISSFPAHVQMNSFKSFERIPPKCDEIEQIISIWNQDVV